MSKSTSKTPTKKQTASSSGAANPSEMKTAEIRDLIDFISKSGLNEVDIETKELKLHVKREPDQKVFKSTPAPVMAAAPVAQVAAPAAAPKAEKAAAAEPATSG